MQLQLAIAVKIFIHKGQWQTLRCSCAITDNKRITPGNQAMLKSNIIVKVYNSTNGHISLSIGQTGVFS